MSFATMSSRHEFFTAETHGSNNNHTTIRRVTQVERMHDRVARNGALLSSDLHGFVATVPLLPSNVLMIIRQTNHDVCHLPSHKVQQVVLIHIIMTNNDAWHHHHFRIDNELLVPD